MAPEPYGIIYCATNKANGKRYVGQTIDTLVNRRKGHLGDAKRSRSSRFGNALLKYGTKGFVWEEIDTAFSYEELNYLERYWIRFYNTVNKDLGYNIESGGDSRPLAEETKVKISQTKLNGFASGRLKVHNVNKPMSQAQKDLLREIKSPAKRKSTPHKNGQLLKGAHHSPTTEFPSVSIQCIETGMIYPTISAASRALGISHTNFAQYWRGHKKSVAGFHWKRLENPCITNT